jgi:hypothetical protein
MSTVYSFYISNVMIFILSFLFFLLQYQKIGGWNKPCPGINGSLREAPTVYSSLLGLLGTEN